MPSLSKLSKVSKAANAAKKPVYKPDTPRDIRKGLVLTGGIAGGGTVYMNANKGKSEAEATVKKPTTKSEEAIRAQIEGRKPTPKPKPEPKNGNGKRSNKDKKKTKNKNKSSY
jgi:hypothetical protein